MGTAAWLVWAGSLAFRILGLIAFVVPQSAAFAGSDQAPYLIDDFEDPAALKNWRSYTSPESPTASGALTLGRRPPHPRRGAVLRFPFGFVSRRRLRFLLWQRTPAAKRCGFPSGLPSSTRNRATGSM